MFVCGELRQGIRYVPLYDHKGERFVVLGYTSNVVFQFVYKSEFLSSSTVVLQKSCSREVFYCTKHIRDNESNNYDWIYIYSETIVSQGNEW